MRIVVDVSPLSHFRTGIGNYLRGMVAGLAEAAGDEHEVVAFAPAGVVGSGRIRRALEGIPVELRIRTLPVAYAWRRAWSRLPGPPVEWLAGRFDVFHFSDWMHPPQAHGLRTTTVHDLVPLRFPDWVQRRTLQMHGSKYRDTARTCDLVLVNSRFTGNDVAEILGVPEERIRVAYPGVDPRFRADGPRTDLGAPYVLAVATLEPRKNLKGLVEAFRVLRARRPELLLAVAGSEGWGDAAPSEREGVRLLGFLPDEELAALYRCASAFAYPSLFEGFGIPVVEAMASGTPAVVSSHPSLDEASGEAALRADPKSPEALAEGLERALDEPGPLVERGLEHASRFTWLACGEAVLAGYESALTDSRRG